MVFVWTLLLVASAPAWGAAYIGTIQFDRSIASGSSCSSAPKAVKSTFSQLSVDAKVISYQVSGCGDIDVRLNKVVSPGNPNLSFINQPSLSRFDLVFSVDGIRGAPIGFRVPMESVEAYLQPKYCKAVQLPCSVTFFVE